MRRNVDKVCAELIIGKINGKEKVKERRWKQSKIKGIREQQKSKKKKA